MSLVKFTNRHVHRGQRMYWGRASEDGLPYRGAAPPSLTQDEAETRLHRVGDPFEETYDLSKPEEKADWLGVMDGIINHWFQCLFIRRWETPSNPHGYVRCAWAEYCLEDGTPVQLMNPALMELAHAPLAFPQQ